MPRSIPPVLPPDALVGRPQPELTGAGLVLRPFESGDAALVEDAFRDPAIRLWHRRSIESRAEAQAWIDDAGARWRAGEAGNWAIVDADAPDGPQPVGRISLTRIHLDGGQGEVSYWVLPPHRGRGMATRAVGVLAAWGFGSIGLHRLELNHSTRNPASCRVAERAGFVPEGTAREALLHDDGWHDMHLHARIAPT